MTDKAEIIVWEKNTETNKVKPITLKQVVGMLNTQNSIEFNDLPFEYYDEWSGKFKTFKSRQWTDLKGFPCYNFWDIDAEHPRTAVNYSVRKA